MATPLHLPLVLIPNFGWGFVLHRSGGIKKKGKNVEVRTGWLPSGFLLNAAAFQI